MKDNWKKAFMDSALRFAEESYAKRLQVGAIVVKDNRIISIGINGMPSGWENICEDKVYMDSDAGGWLDAEQIEEQWPHEDANGRFKLITKSEVLHAETNAITKLAQSSESGQGAALFVTHSPCMDCAKMIYQSGIREVYYNISYRCTKGIDFLKKCGLNVQQIK